MVARGEHGADGAEDYDGEDGDDDAVWLGVLVRLSLVSCACFLVPFLSLSLPRLRRTMSMR